MANENGLVNDCQFEGRPGCEAQFLTLLEELKYDILYLTQRTLFNFDNGAMSCYDHIIIVLASLISCKYGHSPQVVVVQDMARIYDYIPWLSDFRQTQFWMDFFQDFFG
jgi:hypothetical protein